MSILVKDANGNNKYFGTSEVGDVTNPFLSIPADFYLEVVKGNVAGHSIINKFGRNGVVGTTLSHISITGQYQTPQTAQSLEILSSNANDTAAGSGGRKVLVEGLDSNFDIQTEIVTLNGLTPVALTNQFMRVYRMYMYESGSYVTISTPSHLGQITLRGVGAGANWVRIDTVEGTATGFGIGQSQIGSYTIPRGYTAYLLSKTFSVEAAKPTSIYFFKREQSNDVVAPYSGIMRLFEENDGIQDAFHIVGRAPIQTIPEMSEVGFFAKVGTGTASVSVEFQLLLIAN